MTLNPETILFTVAVLFMLSIGASKVSTRVGVPALLLFVGIGMIAGSEGPGGIDFDNPWAAQFLGVVALSFILFAAGFETRWEQIRSILWPGLRLSTLAVVVSSVLVGLFAQQLLGFSMAEGMLLGAIVSSTDAAAVFSVLRARGLNLKPSLARLLEFESGSNDPMAVLLTIGMIRLLAEPSTTPFDLVLLFLQQLAIGAALGYGMGRLMVWVINRARLEWEGLYPVLSVAMVLLVYGATTLLGGSGFLAVYLTGLVLGQSDFIHRKSLRLFHDGLAWMMQIAMFLVLGLQVFPSALLPVAGVGLAISLFLIGVARPLSVFAALLFAGIPVREQIFLSWSGLRGAVPVVLATFPLLAGLDKANTIFNLVFFVALTSVLIQGTTIPLLARWTRSQVPAERKRVFPIEFTPTTVTDRELIELQVSPATSAVGRRILDLKVPSGSLIVLLGRDNQFIVPSGGTILHAGDTLLVLAEKRSTPAIRAIVEAAVYPDDQPRPLAPGSASK